MSAKSAKRRAKRAKIVDAQSPMNTTRESTIRERADAKKPEPSAGDAGTTTPAVSSRPTQCIEFAKSFTRGPCSCYYPMASSAWGLNEDGSSFHRYDPGPKKECMRCKARRALEADGVEYDKDDRLPRTFLAL